MPYGFDSATDDVVADYCDSMMVTLTDDKSFDFIWLLTTLLQSWKSRAASLVPGVY